MDPNDFISSAADGLIGMQSFMASMMQQDQASGMPPGQGMLASMMAPTNVTTSVKAQIAALLKSSNRLILYIHLDQEYEHEGCMYMCAAHEIKKEHGSDGKNYADSDGFGMSLATTAIFDTSRNEPRTKVRILLGTLAKACLEPLVGPGGMSIVPQQMRGMFPPSRPVKVLFQTSGYVEMLRD